MKNNFKYWAKPILVLVAFGFLTWLAPAEPIDPWKLFSPKKIAGMIMTLTLIQALGSVLAKYLGARTGAILTGFFGGLLSSTATTASLARRSKTSINPQSSSESLTFLAATGAMLFEGVALIISGTTEVHLSTVIIFMGPILAILILMIFQYKKLDDQSDPIQDLSFQILPTLKLSVFILAILSISKMCQLFLGQNGLFAITSLVSLFEVHGSLIANTQLHESGAISTKFLCSLYSASIVSSYLSKLFLIWTLGSPSLKGKASKSTAFLFAALLVSWLVAMSLG